MGREAPVTGTRILDLLRTQPGRWLLRRGIAYRSWPLLRALAAAWRRGPVRRTHLVAVVGSYGKTTTARAVAAAVGGGREMEIASNQFGFLAWKLLAVRPGQSHAVVEAGIAGPGQMQPYARMLRPDTVVVTTIGTEHHGSLGTLEGTAREKAAMVRALGPEGTAVLNLDDPLVAGMAPLCRGRVVTYGWSEGSQVRLLDYELHWPRGMSLRLELFGEPLAVQAGLVGRHMSRAVAAAVAVAAATGVPLEAAAEGLAALRPAPGRMQPVPLPSGAWLLRDDYKSGLETVERALEVLAEIPARRRIAVLGDITEPPGRQGPLYRALGGRVARVADLAFFVGNRAQSFAAGARAQGGSREAHRACGTRVRGAIRALEGVPREGDVILLKGRVTQRLERVALALAGRTVRCNIKECRATNLPCSRCAMLERGRPEDPG